MLNKFEMIGGGTLAASKGSCGSAAQEGRVPLATMYRMEVSRCDRREPRLCCTGKESPICRGVRSVTPTDGGLMLQPKGAAALLHKKGGARPMLNM
ncbi:hypothetical protein ROHU_028659 [Labeo rohita]|uniref:Uncharacterized protein n=1 Tax=Labeo rohita TaxID=84645 RepID=A0A498M1G9_LABRO|nr:hypothetical protein ROHU_028659 [Labeo rohita]